MASFPDPRLSSDLAPDTGPVEIPKPRSTVLAHLVVLVSAAIPVGLLTTYFTLGAP